jgi:hypothetical protein
MNANFSKAHRKFYLQRFRPRNQRGQDGRIKFDAMRELSRAAGERGQAVARVVFPAVRVIPGRLARESWSRAEMPRARRIFPG